MLDRRVLANPRDMKRAIRRAIFRIERQMDQCNRHRPDPVLEQEVSDLRETLVFIDKSVAHGVRP